MEQLAEHEAPSAIQVIPRAAIPRAQSSGGDSDARAFLTHEVLARFLPRTNALGMTWVHAAPGKTVAPREHATSGLLIVLSGEATLELDDGVTVVLGPGDTYVQNGTRHRWSNSGSVPAVLAVTLVGAEHRNVD